jgi:hypothetical protein
MYSKFWQVIKDDSRRTFEVCGQETNTNYFTNLIHGMQRAGMNVSYVMPPVTNKTSSKSLVAVSGYKKEEGLQDRLLKEYRVITQSGYDTPGQDD